MTEEASPGGGLPLDGRLTGDQRRSSDGTQLLCDALIVRIEPQHHWLGIYQGVLDDPTNLQFLDRGLPRGAEHGAR